MSAQSDALPRHTSNGDHTMSASAKKSTKSAAKGPSAKRYTFPDKAKIVAIVKDNPAKAGTARHKRLAVLLKHSGKLVADFIAAGGRAATVAKSIERKWI